MSDFKKWLEKKRWDVEAHDSLKGATITEYESKQGRFVLIEDLGKWALENIKERLELDKREPNVDHYHKRYWDIAVACLGKEIVLTELKLS